jgi:hypothetical protein
MYVVFNFLYKVTEVHIILSFMCWDYQVLYVEISFYNITKFVKILPYTLS